MPPLKSQLQDNFGLLCQRGSGGFRHSCDKVPVYFQRTASTYLSGFTDHTYQEMSTPPVPNPPLRQGMCLYY